jgi:hypothetical protein
LLDETVVFDVLICLLGALGLCLCSELVTSVVGVSDLCRCVGFKPLLVGDFVLGLVLLGNVIGTLRRSVILRTRFFKWLALPHVPLTLKLCISLRWLLQYP